MTILNWHDGLNLNISFMDHDHEAAAAAINALADASGADRLPLLDHFISHCRDHFAREEAMMRKTGFFALHCHQGEHQRVLAELESVRDKLAAGDAQDRYFTQGLPAWLLNHRDTMDAVTADFAQQAGYREEAA